MEIKKDETLFNNLRETLLNDLETNKDIIYKSLVEDKDSIVGNLPESIFVNYFLPCFIGKNNNNPNWLLEWISIAGTPSNYVRIFKDGNINETLFYVPPVLNTNFLNNNIRLKDIFSASEDRSINIPILGTMFLYEALNDASSSILNSIDDKYLQEWISIFKRYNLIQEETKNNNTDDLTSYLEF